MDEVITLKASQITNGYAIECWSGKLLVCIVNSDSSVQFHQTQPIDSETLNEVVTVKENFDLFYQNIK